MSTLLDDALAGLGLEPGQTYTTTVGGCEYEIHARDKAALVKPMEEPTTSKPAGTRNRRSSPTW